MENKIVDLQAPFYFLDKNDNIDFKQYIKGIIPYIQDFIEVLKGEGASTYYSSSQKQVVKVEELERLLFKLGDVTYGK